MSSYYNMPENSTLLVVEDVNFPIGNFSYFNLTVLNPSNSASDVNITAFRLTVEETNETYDVATTEYPGQLPFLLARGTRQTFKCIKNWSNLAGDIVRLEPVAEVNASTISYPYVTPKAKLTIAPDFDPSGTVQYFNLTVNNSAESAMNLTISEVKIFAESINATPPLPLTLSPNQTEVLQCNRNWGDLIGQNLTITVGTIEGYESIYETDELLGALPYIANVKFDYADTTFFNMTIGNSEDATVPAIISGAELVFQNGTVFPLSVRLPPLNTVLSTIPPNQSQTFVCDWAWTQYRNENITVRAYSRQGFTVYNMTVVTPAPIVWNVTDVAFDLDDTGRFLVNVTNMPCSLSDINVTMIQLNDQNLTPSPPFAVLASGNQMTFSCATNWTSLIGQTVEITAFTDNGLSISRITTIPFLGLRFLSEPTWEKSPIPYVNITISNSKNSLVNATLVKVIFKTENRTYEVDGTLTNPPLTPNGSILGKGESVTIACPWNWTLYSTSDLTVTIRTEDGTSISQTFKIPEYTP
jgi:hypothetical protein